MTTVLIWAHSPREFEDRMYEVMETYRERGFVLACPPTLTLTGANSIVFGTILTFTVKK